jgi:hypothetical protein
MGGSFVKLPKNLAREMAIAQLSMEDCSTGQRRRQKEVVVDCRPIGMLK